MIIVRDETFGPIIPVMSFKTIDDAIALANDTEFGMTASVIARDEAEALPIALRINAGAVLRCTNTCLVSPLVSWMATYGQIGQKCE
jgi:acyl-CoA reductase-like NAD-dependent aldehyde dehydrogenase